MSKGNMQDISIPILTNKHPSIDRSITDLQSLATYSMNHVEITCLYHECLFGKLSSLSQNFYVIKGPHRRADQPLCW